MAQYTEADLKQLTKEELVEEAESHQLDAKGTKAVLIARLLEFDARDTNDDEDELDDDDLVEPDSDDDELDDDEEPVAEAIPDDEDDDEVLDESVEDDEVIEEEADEVDGPADDTEAEAVKAKREADAKDIKAVASRPEPDEDDDLELDEEEVDTPEPAPKKRSSRTPKAVKAADKAVKEEADGTGTIPAKQVASMLGVEAKTLRQFFRSPSSTVEAVGAGGRYEFAESDVDTIKAEFEKWRSEHAARGTKRDTSKPKGAKPKPEVVEVEDAEELDIDELDDEVDEDELELEDED